MAETTTQRLDRIEKALKDLRADAARIGRGTVTRDKLAPKVMQEVNYEITTSAGFTLHNGTFALPKTITWDNDDTDMHSVISGYAQDSVGASSISISSFGESGRSGGVITTGGSSDGGAGARLIAVSGASSVSSLILTATPDLTVNLGGSPVFKLESTNRSASFYGRIYPGTGSATQTSRYISDNGSSIAFEGALAIDGDVVLESGHDVYADRFYPGDQSSAFIDFAGGTFVLTSGLSVGGNLSVPGAQFGNSGGSGLFAVPSNCVTFWEIVLGSSTYRIPLFATT